MRHPFIETSRTTTFEYMYIMLAFIINGVSSDTFCLTEPITHTDLQIHM